MNEKSVHVLYDSVRFTLGEEEDDENEAVDEKNVCLADWDALMATVVMFLAEKRRGMGLSKICMPIGVEKWLSFWFSRLLEM